MSVAATKPGVRAAAGSPSSERSDAAGAAPAPSQPAALLDRAAVARRCGISTATLDRWRAARMAPEPDVRKGGGRGKGRILRWSEATIDAWIGQGLPDMDEFVRPCGRGG